MLNYTLFYSTKRKVFFVTVTETLSLMIYVLWKCGNLKP